MCMESIVPKVRVIVGHTLLLLVKITVPLNELVVSGSTVCVCVRARACERQRETMHAWEFITHYCFLPPPALHFLVSVAKHIVK